EDGERAPAPCDGQAGRPSPDGGGQAGLRAWPAPAAAARRAPVGRVRPAEGWWTGFGRERRSGCQPPRLRRCAGDVRGVPRLGWSTMQSVTRRAIWPSPQWRVVSLAACWVVWLLPLWWCRWRRAGGVAASAGVVAWGGVRGCGCSGWGGGGGGVPGGWRPRPWWRRWQRGHVGSRRGGGAVVGARAGRPNRLAAVSPRCERLRTDSGACQLSRQPVQ